MWCAVYQMCSLYGRTSGRLARNASRSRSSAVSFARVRASRIEGILDGSERAAWRFAASAADSLTVVVLEVVIGVVIVTDVCGGTVTSVEVTTAGTEPAPRPAAAAAPEAARSTVATTNEAMRPIDSG